MKLVDGRLRHDRRLPLSTDGCAHSRTGARTTTGRSCEGDWEPDEGVVVCPRHGSRFDICSGRPLSLPAYCRWRPSPCASRTGWSSSPSTRRLGELCADLARSRLRVVDGEDDAPVAPAVRVDHDRAVAVVDVEELPLAADRGSVPFASRRTGSGSCPCARRRRRGASAVPTETPLICVYGIRSSSASTARRESPVKRMTSASSARSMRRATRSGFYGSPHAGRAGDGGARAARARGRRGAGGGRAARAAVAVGRAHHRPLPVLARRAADRLRGARDRRLARLLVDLARRGRSLPRRTAALARGGPGEVRGVAAQRRRGGLEEWAELVEGDARETLPAIDDVFDVVFLDAEKEDYEELFGLARPKLEPARSSSPTTSSRTWTRSGRTRGPGRRTRRSSASPSRSTAASRSRRFCADHPVRYSAESTTERRWSGEWRFPVRAVEVPAGRGVPPGPPGTA